MTAFFFIFGLFVGSFLNVVICRIRSGKTFVSGRSFCPRCDHQISWHDNIPLLSFCWLKGKCRHCHQQISYQYPLVEFFSGLIFAMIGYFFFSPYIFSGWLTLAFYLVFFSSLIIIFVYDVKFMEVPMDVIWFGSFVAIVYWLLIDWTSYFAYVGFFDFQIVWAIISGVVGFLFFYAFARLSNETLMGYGDAYLGLMVGLSLGWPGIILALMLSFIIGGLYGIIVLMLKKKTPKSQIPYAPFLALGSLLVVILPQLFPWFFETIFLFY